MRIGLTGPEGSGKTTVALVLKEMKEFSTHAFIPEGVEETLKDMGLWSKTLLHSLTTLRGDPPSYFRFQKQLSLNKHVNESNHKDFIIDRTQADNLAYTLLYLRDFIEDVDAKEFVEIQVERCRIYDLIFYFPMATNRVGEGRRLTSYAHVTTFDSLLRGIHSRFQIPFVEITAESVEGRVQEILDHVAHHMGLR